MRKIHNKKVYHVSLYIMEIGTSTKLPWKRDTTIIGNLNKKVYHVPLYIMEIGTSTKIPWKRDTT